MPRYRDDSRIRFAVVALTTVLAAGTAGILLASGDDGSAPVVERVAGSEPEPGTGPKPAPRPKPATATRRDPKPRPRPASDPEPAVRSESRAEIGAVPGDPRPAIAGGGEVLVVGDSLEVATSPHLERHLPGVALTVDARKSASSAAILGFLRRSYLASHSVVVFDAGTNDDPAYPGVLAANLAAAAELVGRRCLVVPTVQRPPVDGVGPEAINETIRRFAASRPRTEVPDWAGAVRHRPDLLEPDGVHPTAAGADQRARLIAAAVSACLGSSSAGAGS